MNRLNKPSHPENKNLQKQLPIKDFHRYYPLCSITETLWFIEQEYRQYDSTQKQSIEEDYSTNKNPTSITEIIVALGFITTLLCFAGVRLHRSINIESAKAQNQTGKVYSGNSLTSFSRIYPKQFAWRI